MVEESLDSDEKTTLDYFRQLRDYRRLYVDRRTWTWLALAACLLFALIVWSWASFRSFDPGAGPLAANVRRNFIDPLQRQMGVALFRPITVTLFERPASIITPPAEKSSALYDVDDYNERLIVIRPNNWLIYTFNGITFHYIVNNVNRSRMKCSSANGLTAVEYRLKTKGESTESYSNTVRNSCIHYTLDQLIRLFNTTSNRTDVDLTDYFDRNKYSNAPKFSVFSVLEFLVHNRLV